MLVVMEHRDVHPFPQGCLNGKAFGGLDIFQIDPAEGGFEQGDSLDELFRIGGVYFDIEHVDIGEFLEQDGFAFHHRLRSQCANRAQTEHSGAVGNDSHQIAAGGIVEGFVRVCRDFNARCRDTRGIGQREIPLVDHTLRRFDAKFTGLGETVIFERGVADSFVHAGLHMRDFPDIRGASWP